MASVKVTIQYELKRGEPVLDIQTICQSVAFIWTDLYHTVISASERLMWQLLCEAAPPSAARLQRAFAHLIARVNTNGAQWVSSMKSGTCSSDSGFSEPLTRDSPDNGVLNCRRSHPTPSIAAKCVHEWLELLADEALVTRAAAALLARAIRVPVAAVACSATVGATTSEQRLALRAVQFVHEHLLPWTRKLCDSTIASLVLMEQPLFPHPYAVAPMVAVGFEPERHTLFFPSPPGQQVKPTTAVMVMTPTSAPGAQRKDLVALVPTQASGGEGGFERPPALDAATIESAAAVLRERSGVPSAPSNSAGEKEVGSTGASVGVHTNPELTPVDGATHMHGSGGGSSAGSSASSSAGGVHVPVVVTSPPPIASTSAAALLPQTHAQQQPLAEDAPVKSAVASAFLASPHVDCTSDEAHVARSSAARTATVTAANPTAPHPIADDDSAATSRRSAGKAARAAHNLAFAGGPGLAAATGTVTGRRGRQHLLTEHQPSPRSRYADTGGDTTSVGCASTATLVRPSKLARKGDTTSKSTKHDHVPSAPDVTPVDAFCVPGCTNDSEEKMVKCDGASCQAVRKPISGEDGEWYHLSCLGISEGSLPTGRGKWFCPTCQRSSRK